MAKKTATAKSSSQFLNVRLLAKVFSGEKNWLWGCDFADFCLPDT